MRPSAEKPRPLAAGEKIADNPVNPVKKIKIVKIESISHAFIYLKFHICRMTELRLQAGRSVTLSHLLHLRLNATNAAFLASRPSSIHRHFVGI
jgi:hypothetical protein